MDDNVKKELDTFKMMVSNWAESYLDWVEESDNEWLMEELANDVRTWLVPQMKRLRELEYITLDEYIMFWGDINRIVYKFSEDIKKEKKKEISEVDIRSLFSQFNVHKDLIETKGLEKGFYTEQKVKLADIALILVPALYDKLKEENNGKD